MYFRFLLKSGSVATTMKLVVNTLQNQMEKAPLGAGFNQRLYRIALEGCLTKFNQRTLTIALGWKIGRD